MLLVWTQTMVSICELPLPYWSYSKSSTRLQFRFLPYLTRHSRDGEHTTRLILKQKKKIKSSRVFIWQLRVTRSDKSRETPGCFWNKYCVFWNDAAYKKEAGGETTDIMNKHGVNWITFGKDDGSSCLLLPSGLAALEKLSSCLLGVSFIFIVTVLHCYCIFPEKLWICSVVFV